MIFNINNAEGIRESMRDSYKSTINYQNKEKFQKLYRTLLVFMVLYQVDI